MIRIFLIASGFLFLPVFATSQNIFTDLQKQSANNGKITIFQDADAESLVLKNIELDQKHKGTCGYRLQIYSGTGNSARNEARQIQSKFISLFPEIQTYMIYQEPYFKIRVGDFRSKSEGLKTKKQIQTEFPDCYFVIENDMSYPKL
ncbi:MAG: SPOR domain-containing protein [Bacteroidia bacterium]|nr:SPOR domain-containing protein [Bacteroidia bacterium]